jgi:hypothetical protein
MKSQRRRIGAPALDGRHRPWRESAQQREHGRVEPFKWNSELIRSHESHHIGKTLSRLEGRKNGSFTLHFLIVCALRGRYYEPVRMFCDVRDSGALFGSTDKQPMGIAAGRAHAC